MKNWYLFLFILDLFGALLPPYDLMNVFLLGFAVFMFVAYMDTEANG